MSANASGDVPALRPNDYRDTWCGQVLPDRVDSEARLAGWVHRRRDHGGLVFIDLRDRTGIVQLVFHPERSGEAFELAHRLRAEDVISVAGPVVRRSTRTKPSPAGDATTSGLSSNGWGPISAFPSGSLSCSCPSWTATCNTVSALPPSGRRN